MVIVKVDKVLAETTEDFHFDEGQAMGIMGPGWRLVDGLWIRDRCCCWQCCSIGRG